MNGIADGTKDYIISKCKYDANFVVRMVCAEVEKGANKRIEKKTSRVAYYCYKHKRYRMTTAKRLRNVIQDLFRAKIDDNVQNQK